MIPSQIISLCNRACRDYYGGDSKAYEECSRIKNFAEMQGKAQKRREISYKEARLRFASRISYYKEKAKNARKKSFAWKGFVQKLAHYQDLQDDLFTVGKISYDKRTHQRINRSLAQLIGRGARLSIHLHV